MTPVVAPVAYDVPWLALATIFAVVVGPVIAVLTARHLDFQRANKERKLDIFRTLMRTRRVRLHWEHVGALNLVEVEFIGHTAVVDAWKAYLTNLGKELPATEQRDRYDVAIKERDFPADKTNRRDCKCAWDQSYTTGYSRRQLCTAGLGRR